MGDQRIRNLKEICDKEDLHIKILGNTYCSIGISRKVECPYYSKETDQNGLHTCENPLYCMEVVSECLN